LGLSSWVLGYPSRAVESSIAGLALADELSQPLTTALALVWGCGLRQLRREVVVTRKQAEAVIALSTEHGFPQWLAAGNIFDGWARAEQGESDAGIAQIRQGLTAYRATGAEVWVPYFLSLLAVEYLKFDEPGVAFNSIAESLEVAKTTAQHLWQAELCRLKVRSCLLSGLTVPVRQSGASARRLTSRLGSPRSPGSCGQ
jgi:predicted ATPase